MHMCIYIYICMHICACTHLHTSENECMMNWPVHVSYVKAHTWCWVNQTLQHLTHHTQYVGICLHTEQSIKTWMCVWVCLCCFLWLNQSGKLHQVVCNRPGTILSSAQLGVHQMNTISAMLHPGPPAYLFWCNIKYWHIHLPVPPALIPVIHPNVACPHIIMLTAIFITKVCDMPGEHTAPTPITFLVNPALQLQVTIIIIHPWHGWMGLDRIGSMSS